MPAPYPSSPKQLESALLITLRDTLRWGSALAPVTASGTYSGTLTASGAASQPLAALGYQRRDRELAWLDTRNAAAVVEVSLEIADVWNAAAIRPKLEGAQVGHLDYNSQDVSANGMLSRVVHVRNASIPLEALQVDRDLAGRDILIYETLYNACNLFASPPITTSGATVPEISAFSFAQGTAAQRDISPSLPLDRDLFKVPDMNLAERDNQMAGYVSQICQVLKNPFAYADRLYVAVEGVDSREVETYTLIAQPFQAGLTYLEGDEITYQDILYRVKSGTGTTSEVPWLSSAWQIVTSPRKRVWTAEPALSGRNRFVYDTEEQTVQWFRESADIQHIPQLVAMSVAGMFSGQTFSLLAKIPERKDGQFWRNKAAHVVPAGANLTDMYSLPSLATEVQSGFTIQSTGASLTVPGRATVFFPADLVSLAPETIPAGTYRISALVEPNALVELDGASNLEEVVSEQQGATFAGYSQLTYLIGLPPTQWTVEFDYTNLSASTSGFRLTAALGGAIIFEDTAPFYFNDLEGNPLPNGTVVTSPAFPLFPTGGSQLLSLRWSGGGGQLHIRAIRFRSATQAQGHFRVTGTLAQQVAAVDVIGTDGVAGVVNWDFVVAAPSQDNFEINFEADAQLPLRFLRMDLAATGTNTPTPNAQGFENYRQDCLVRAVRSANQAFKDAYFSGTEAGTFLSYGTLWDGDATERWMATIESAEPRLRELDDVTSDGVVPGRHYYVSSGSVLYEGKGYATGESFIGNVATAYTWASVGKVKQVGAWIQSKATHNGRPGLAPRGVYFDYEAGTIAVAYSPDLTTPELVTLQPWMIKTGFYAAQRDFWLPSNV